MSAPPGGGTVPPGGVSRPGGGSKPGGGTVGAASATDLASVMSMLHSGANGGAIDVEMLRLLGQMDVQSAEVETFGAEAQAELAAALAEAQASAASGGGNNGLLGVPPGGVGGGGGGGGPPPVTATRDEIAMLMQSLHNAGGASVGGENSEFAAMMAQINDAGKMSTYGEEAFPELTPPPPLSSAGSRMSLTGGMGAEAYTTHDGTMQSGAVYSSTPRASGSDLVDPTPYSTLPPPTSDDLGMSPGTPGSRGTGGVQDGNPAGGASSSAAMGVGVSSAATLAAAPVKESKIEKEQCVKHGWMEKLGGRKKDKWQRRWAELDMDPSPDGKHGGNFVLSYKGEPMDKKVKGIINLTSCTVSTRVPQEEAGGKEYVIRLDPAYGAKKKAYVLGFFDASERDDWLAALNAAVTYNSQNRKR